MSFPQGVPTAADIKAHGETLKAALRAQASTPERGDLIIDLIGQVAVQFGFLAGQGQFTPEDVLAGAKMFVASTEYSIAYGKQLKALSPEDRALVDAERTAYIQKLFEDQQAETRLAVAAKPFYVPGNDLVKH